MAQHYRRARQALGREQAELSQARERLRQGQAHSAQGDSAWLALDGWHGELATLQQALGNKDCLDAVQETKGRCSELLGQVQAERQRVERLWRERGKALAAELGPQLARRLRAVEAQLNVVRLGLADLNRHRLEEAGP